MAQRRLPTLAAALAFAAPHAHAQLSSGITAAAFSWEEGHREQALAAVLQVAPTPWLLLGAVPTVLRVQRAPGAQSQFGLADLPVYAAVFHSGRSLARPTIAVTGSASVPTGDQSRGLGRGFSLMSAELALAADPAPGLTIRGGAARLLRVGGDAPRGLSTTTLFGDVVLGSRSLTSLALGGYGELAGEAPAGYETARGLTATLAHTLRGGTTLVLGAGRTVAGSGPNWSFSLGIGTAFGGVSPVGATAPVVSGGVPRTVGSGPSPLCAIARC
ncbi:MAG TPA: hypothetical protein VK922_05495 [Gemmatimonadaceae bacterium]|nr:hypothetical protein [Gemmatimonadaceae bacterium]